MKKALIFTISVLLTLNIASASVIISSFGSSLESDDFTGSWFGNYNSGTSTVTANDGPGSGISDYTNIVIADIIGQTQFSLTASVTGINPSTDFQIFLEDSVGNTATANYNWSAFFTTPTTVLAPINFDPGFSTDSIIGWNLTTGGVGSGLTVSFTNLTAVPEPNTWLLVGVSLAIFIILRRRRAV